MLKTFKIVSIKRNKDSMDVIVKASGKNDLFKFIYGIEKYWLQDLGGKPRLVYDIAQKLRMLDTEPEKDKIIKDAEKFKDIEYDEDIKEEFLKKNSYKEGLKND